MKDYASMSDFEINCRVAIALGMKEHFFMDADGDDCFDDDIAENERGPIWQTCKYRVGDYHPSNGNCFNPCNNPADAWPIITENRIGIIPAPDAGKWKSAHREVGEDDTPYHFTQSDNPLRAAMIVFLMMKEGKK